MSLPIIQALISVACSSESAIRHGRGKCRWLIWPHTGEGGTAADAIIRCLGRRGQPDELQALRGSRDSG